MGYMCISIQRNTKYFDQIFRSSFSGLTKRGKESHKKLKEEAQNRTELGGEYGGGSVIVD